MGLNKHSGKTLIQGQKVDEFTRLETKKKYPTRAESKPIHPYKSSAGNSSMKQ